MTECFIVAKENRDGSFPVPEAYCHELLFYDIQDAREFLAKFRYPATGTKIFKCQIEITEKMDH